MEVERKEETKKVVLITGCSSGIGEALTDVFGKDYSAHYVVYATARRIDSLKDLVSRHPKGVIRPIAIDVQDDESVKKGVQQILQESGKIDVLINNAGISHYGALLDMPMEDFQTLFNTNVAGPFRLIKEVAPDMIRRAKGGLIVNIGSVVGIFSTPYTGAYCATKAAVHGYTQSLRMELAPFNIKVVIVAPGGIQSSINVKGLKNEWASSEFYSEVAEYISHRSSASQENPMPAAEFAKGVISEIEKPQPRSWVFLGTKSWLLPFAAKWIPQWVLDTILMRKYGLMKLKMLWSSKLSNKDDIGSTRQKED